MTLSTDTGKDIRFANLMILLFSYIIIDQVSLYADINIYEHI